MAEITTINLGQGETLQYTKVLRHPTGVPMDLSQYTWEGQIRENYTTENVAGIFYFDTGYAPTSGSLTIGLSAADSLLLTQRKYVFSVNAISGSSVIRAVEGYIIVRPTAIR